MDDCKDYWDDAYDEIIQEIKEEHIDLSLEENAEWDNPEVMEGEI